VFTGFVRLGILRGQRLIGGAAARITAASCSGERAVALRTRWFSYYGRARCQGRSSAIIGSRPIARADRGLGLEAQQAAVCAYLGSSAPIAEFTEVETAKRNDRPELERALALCRPV
jgi:hypothetical protein